MTSSDSTPKPEAPMYVIEPSYPRPPKPKAEYTMTQKQLASSVRQGRRINISILDEDMISGYLAGWDDETYLLVDGPTGDSKELTKLLIPRRNILFIQLVGQRSFQEEPRYSEMNEIVRSFRDWINSNVFTSGK